MRVGTAVAAELAFDGVVKHYGESRALDGLSLTIDPGEVVCLLGPSGCGKTTLLRIAAGIERPDAGRVLINGLEVAGPDRFVQPEARGVGLMFQDFALFPHLSVADNVAFGLKGTRTEKRLRVRALLYKVGLQRYMDAFPHELSGGEQQRVALARALAPSPRILLMDEPFSGLDNRLRDDIRDETLSLLKEEGTAVVLVTHEPEEAMRMADEILLMRKGAIVQRGAPYNIYNAPVDREAAAFFSDVNTLSGEVEGALVDTAFGQFLAPGYPDGAEVEIVIRPQHLKIDFDRAGQGPSPTAEHGVWARARVERARFVGTESIVEFVLDGDCRMKATVPNVFLPKAGTLLWIALRRDRCFVFPAGRARR